MLQRLAKHTVSSIRIRTLKIQKGLILSYYKPPQKLSITKGSEQVRDVKCHLC